MNLERMNALALKMNSPEPIISVEFVLSVLFNAIIVVVVLDYIMQRILSYKHAKLFEKMIFDCHLQVSRCVDTINDNNKKNEEQWACKLDDLNERFESLFLSYKENFVMSINHEFDQVEEYVKKLDTEFDKVEKYIKNLERDLWIDIRNIREEWCEKNRDRITEIEEDLDDYSKRIGSRFRNLEEILDNNVGIQSSLTQKVSSLEDSMLDKFCKVAEMKNISDNSIGDLYCCLEMTKMTECIFVESALRNTCDSLMTAMKICLPNFNFDKYLRENMEDVRVRAGRVSNSYI
jgi:phage host-nuclease inhibitor protein Gam